jgi:hypothetical protein
MRLDRNVNPDGRGKYGLVNLREEDDGRVIHGEPGTKEEFFVIKLKDKHSKAALLAYADSVEFYDKEFAEDVRELAARAGRDNPWCKDPD